MTTTNSPDSAATPTPPGQPTSPASTGWKAWPRDHKIQFASAVAAIAAVIVSVVPLLTGGEDGQADNKGGTAATSPSAKQSPPSEAPSPSASPSAEASKPATYTPVYKAQKMSISVPDAVGALDLDAPTSTNYGDAEWRALNEDADNQGQPIEPDLTYMNSIFGYLAVPEGHYAVHLDTPPNSPAECATNARVGGFDEATLADWPLKVGSGFCLVTDQGNVAWLKITRFVGGDRDSKASAPERVEFDATMWRAG